MKFKITIITIVLAVLIAIGCVSLYVSATKPLKNGKEAAIERAKNEAGLTEVISADWFHYTENYYVIDGKDTKDDELYVWVPEDSKKDIFIKKKSAGMSEKELLNFIQSGLGDLSNDKKPKKIIRIKLGMIDNAPAYEVTYRDQENRYSILYVDFYHGEWYRVYNL